MKVKPFSRLKHEMLHSYIRTWLAITRQRSKGAKWYDQYLIDGYCGDGLAEYDSSIVKKGSALIFADLLRISSKIILYLNDSDPKMVQKLEDNLKTDKGTDLERIKITSNDFNLIIDDMLVEIDKNIAIFLLDPKGVKDLPWKTVEKIGKRSKRLIDEGCKGGRTEIFINYMQYAIDRNAGYNKPIIEDGNTVLTFFDNIPITDQQIIESKDVEEDFEEGPNRRIHNDNFFGSDEWREHWDTGRTVKERRSRLLELYKNNLRNYFSYITEMPVCHGQRPLYYMIYATNNSAGIKEVEKVVKKIKEGETFIKSKVEKYTHIALQDYF